MNELSWLDNRVSLVDTSKSEKALGVHFMSKNPEHAGLLAVFKLVLVNRGQVFERMLPSH